MSRKVYCGDVAIGGGAPVSIQSMTNVDTRDTDALVRQISELADAGCQIVRCAIPDMEAAESFGRAKKLVRVPLVADIHFDYRLAIAAIENGADKIRINPGNIGSTDRVKAVVDKAREHDIPIRVGVNSGSLQKDLIEKYGGVTADALAESGAAMVRYIEDLGYDKLVVSIKSSNVKMNYDAHMKLKDLTDAAIHVGITESGTPRNGELKSAIGIGALLLAGIGDTMRVSLTADPVNEVLFARRILETVGMREKAIDVVSCPTCGRTEIDLIGLANEAEDRLMPIAAARAKAGRRPLKVAVMGCAVNGPGESREADYGIAGGHGEGLVFRRGEIIEKVAEDRLVDRLIELVEKDAE
ncbi:MAG: flavodoxin-dependent (E)-4-hydroxy-3-methylbut-2-enyl-diphosphate synthase [Clostridiales bacterium]|jgi:(E)-4-hydroxy-3-methylbut-2-enyl-diphosphate synthase|nr:flavodoxin-dependent (E)-4-hydroxy-3-methylbut-2-enyl-diphosphate synthase [Clostridiales bacterium]